jgi:hypothetical protein
VGNRRDFLLRAFAGGGVLLTGGVLQARRAPAARAAPGADAAAPPYRLIVDGRFAVAHGLIDAARRRGVRPHLIDGDVTDLWYHDLALRWRTRPAPIAGLTTVGALFCLERLAWDAGMRLHWRAEHRCYGDGRVEHLLPSPGPRLSRAEARALAGPQWSRALLPLLTRPSVPQGRAGRVIVGAPASVQAGHPEWLASWYIGARPARV